MVTTTVPETIHLIRGRAVDPMPGIAVTRERNIEIKGDDLST